MEDKETNLYLEHKWSDFTVLKVDQLTLIVDRKSQDQQFTPFSLNFFNAKTSEQKFALINY